MAEPGITGNNRGKDIGNIIANSGSGTALSRLILSHNDLSTSHYDLSGSHYALKGTVGELSGSHYSLKNTVGELSGSHYSLKNTVGELSGSHYSLKNTVGELSGSHYSLKNTVGELSGSHYSLKNTVGELSGSHYSLKNTVGELSGSHYSLKGTVNELSGSHYSLKNTVGELSGSHYSLKNTVGELSGSHYSLKGTVNELSGSHYSLKNTVNELSGSHYSLKNTVGELSGSHYSLKGTVNELSGSHYSLKGTVNEISGSHYSLKNTFGELSGSHYSLKGTVNELSGSHYSLKGTVGELSGSHYSLKGTVNDLSTNNNIRFNNIDSSLGQVYTKTESTNLYVSKSNIDLSNLSTNIIPSVDNTYKLGDISKNWRNAYIKDISATNIDISNKLNVIGPTQLANTLTVGGNVTFNSSTLYVPSTFTIDPYGYEDNTGTLFVNGNLTVQGLTTTINSSVVDISDKRIVLASNAKNSIEATGAGIEISGANVNFIYDYPSSAFRSSIGINISGNVVPATNSVVSLGESAKKWDIAYIRELNVTSFTNSINGSNITQGTITTTQIANNTIVDGDISNSAAIAFSKINTTNAIVNSDISNSAAIAFSKINSTNAIVNSDISNSAAIAFSKINTTNAIVNSDISNNAAIAFSKINTTNAIVNSDISNSAAIAFSKINTTNAIVNSDISNSAAIAFSKINASLAIVDADISNSAAISGFKIASGTITTTQIANNTIVDGDISNSAAIAFSKINASLAIVDADISNSAAISGFKIASGTITTTQIANATILGTDISFGQIGEAHFDASLTEILVGFGDALNAISAEGAITSFNIANNTIIDGDISANASIAFSKINASLAITDADISNSAAISGSKIASGTITTTQIANNTIVDGDISNSAAIAFSKINASLAITDSDISNSAAISGSKIASRTITSDKIDQSNNWTFSQLTSNTAYIRDVSVTNISVSGNIIPLDTSRSDLGSLSKRWRNIYANDISINTINGQAYSAAPSLTAVSTNIIPSTVNSNLTLGNSTNIWSNAYIKDISVTNISVSGNIILNIGGGNIRNINQLSADTSNNSITTRNRIYQNISTNINDICWNSVNGYYGLAKDAYPALNPYSSGATLVSNFTVRTIPSDISRNDYWNSICWSPELRLFVAVSSSSTLPNKCIMTSNDGITWSSQSSINGFALNAVTWSPKLGMFVALGSIDYGTGISGSLYSYNGYNWNPVITKMRGTGAICWSPELEMFTACTDIGGTFYSYNGISWFSNTGITANSMCWSPELKIFVGAGAGMIYSSDGINWSTSSSGFGFTGNYYYSVCWSSQVGKFVAVSGAYPIIYSYDGKVWIVAVSGVSGGGGSARDLTSVIWSAQLGLFIAAGSNARGAKLYYSNDGINWTEKYQIDDFTCRRMCWSPELGILVTVGNTSYNVNYPGYSIILTSSLKARPPTSYNVFDSSFNSIDETGKWTFQNIDISTNLNPRTPLSGNLGTSSNPWGNANIRDLSIGSIDISVNLNPLLPNKGTIGLSNRPWGNAYINDISATNLEISGNILPLRDISSDLGSSLRRWRNIYVNDLSVTRINGQAYSATTAINLTSVSGNIIPYTNNQFKLGDVSRNWSNAYIHDISATNISVSGNFILNIGGTMSDITDTFNNLGNTFNAITTSISNIDFKVIDLSNNKANIANPTFSGLISISGNIIPLFDISSDLGSETSKWRNIYVNDLSVNRINGFVYSAGGGGGGTAIDLTSVSTNIIPASNNQFKLGDVSRNWSNAYIRDISATNISISGNIIFSVSGGSMRIAADASNFSITTSHRLYQNISGGINNLSWSAVNGYYALAKDVYPALNPLSNGVKAVTTWTARLVSQSTIHSVCWSPQCALFVAVGLNVIITSPDGISWTSRTVPQANDWLNVCWSPELRLFVAVSNGALRVMTSTNGIDWDGKTAIAADWWGICWSPELGKFVAVAESGSDVMTSINGSDWDPKPAIAGGWRNVCWSPELRLFVAVGISGTTFRVMTSPDGISWTGRTSPIRAWWGICWSPELGIFVVVADGGSNVMTSINGSDWTLRTAITGRWFQVCWSPQLRLFVAAGYQNSNVMTSPNGIDWTARPANEASGWWGICWSPEVGIFVAVASYIGTNRVMTSSLKGRPPTSYNVFDSSFNSIDENGNWTFSNITTNSRIYQNISGGINDLSWTAVNGYYALAKDVYPALNPLSYGETAVSTWTSLAVIINGWFRICWSSRYRIFVAVGNGHASNNRVMTSSNGITWNTVPLLYNTHNWWGVTYSEELNLFVAVADYAPPGNLNKVMTSPDGINWLTKTSNNNNEFSSICWSPQLRIFVTLGNGNSNGRLMTSFNGEVWTTRILSNISTTNVWTNVCWSPELRIFVAVGMAGTDRVMTSNDGINWTTRTISNTNSWTSICWSAKLGIFVAVANTGTLNRVMTSPNGINWTTRTTNNNNWESVCWASELGLFVAIASSGSLNRVMSSPNGINWTTRTTPDNSRWANICWSPELGIFAAVGGYNYLAAERGVMISSLKGRPPTSYNVFDSSFNSIDESGNWTFQNISISGNIVPLHASRSDLGSSLRRWRNIYANDLSINTINGQAYSAGGLTANSVNSSHIINGSILTEDICDNAITNDKIAANAVTNTKIANDSITHAKLTGNCVQSHNIVDGTILGTDICNNTITGSKIADGTIPYTKLDATLQTFISNVYMGIFEITNNINGGTFNASFYYMDDASAVYLFQTEELTSAGDTKFIAYSTLPQNFAVIPFYLESDQAIVSYDLSYAYPLNGITNHSQVGAGKIQFNILRNSQHYLELKILTYVAPPANTGWYGNIYMELLSFRSIQVGYTYTIYKGSTTASGVLVNLASLSTTGINSVAVSSPHYISDLERLANPSSSFLVVINGYGGGDFRLDSVVNVGSFINAYNITPQTIPNDVRIRFSIETP
jgi:hypothetical protein